MHQYSGSNDTNVSPQFFQREINSKTAKNKQYTYSWG